MFSHVIYIVLLCKLNAKNILRKKKKEVYVLTVVVDLVKERYKISQSLLKIVGIDSLSKGRTHSFCRCLFRNEYLITGVKLETPKNASHVDSFPQYDYVSSNSALRFASDKHSTLL